MIEASKIIEIMKAAKDLGVKKITIEGDKISFEWDDTFQLSGNQSITIPFQNPEVNPVKPMDPISPSTVMYGAPDSDWIVK